MVQLGNSILAPNYMFRVNNRNAGRHSGAFIVNFEHISYVALVFLLLTLSRYMPARILFFYFTFVLRQKTKFHIYCYYYYYYYYYGFCNFLMIIFTYLKRKFFLKFWKIYCFKKLLIVRGGNPLHSVFYSELTHLRSINYVLVYEHS